MMKKFINPGLPDIRVVNIADDLTTQYITTTLSQVASIDNPFLNDSTSNNGKAKCIHPIVGAVALSAGGWVAIAGLVIGAAIDIAIAECDRSLSADMYNCSQRSDNKRCVERDGLCHYKCITCPQN